MLNQFIKDIEYLYIIRILLLFNNDFLISLFMSMPLEQHINLKKFKSIHHNKIKYPGPLVLRMYGELNKINLRRENRYILCNFLDQYSDKLGISDDIYKTNNNKSLNRLFITAFTKAKESKLIQVLYDEYIDSINAISEKKTL
jgi:hypothetical protein